MARYSPEHKEATRRRMIEAAGRRFKSDGIDGSGIAALVADAGLTNGAFYGHFASKDDLVASVVAQQLEDQVAVVNSLPAGLSSVEAFLREYLSPAHRDDLAGGCPSAALLDEITRQDVATREAYTDGARALIAAIARHLADGASGDDTSVQARAIGIFTLLVGSLQAARAVTDPELSDQILASSYQNAMRIADPSASLSRNPTVRFHDIVGGCPETLLAPGLEVRHVAGRARHHVGQARGPDQERGRSRLQDQPLLGPTTPQTL